MHIVKVDPVRLRGTIPEVSAPEIRVGQPVTVKLSAVPGKEYKGTISRISPSSSQESRSFMVEILIPNGDGALKPGYFAEASVKTHIDKDAMVVPLNSVVNFAGVNKLYVVEGGKAVERVVTPGVRVGDDTEVAGARHQRAGPGLVKSEIVMPPPQGEEAHPRPPPDHPEADHVGIEELGTGKGADLEHRVPPPDRADGFFRRGIRHGTSFLSMVSIPPPVRRMREIAVFLPAAFPVPYIIIKL